MAFEFIDDELAQRESQDLLRSHVCIEEYQQQFVKVSGQSFLNFSSNDYLGLAQAEIETDTNIVGSGGSPLVTGYSAQHRALCEHIAQNTEREAVLLFNSGFAANSSVCQALMNQEQQLIFSDKLIHASFIDGAMASKAQYKRFKHNDSAQLTQLLQKYRSSYRDVLVASESVFSMDGDQAPVSELVRQCQEHDAWLMLDDAHGLGVLGKNGWGIVEQGGFEQEHIPILIGTFGKAVGTGGAFVAGSNALIEYLSNFARHYIYSTAFSPLHAATTLAHLNAMSEQNWRREKLNDNIQHFRALATQLGIPLTASVSAIQPIMIGEPKRALMLSEQLMEKGFWVKAIRHPTVPKNSDRLRITLTSMHEKENITGLLQILTEAMSR